MSFFDKLKRLVVPSRENAYRPHLLRRGPLLVLLALALVSEAALVGVVMARQSGNHFLAAVVSSQIISLTNTERMANNVSQLTENTQLDQAAQAKANDMTQKGYFAHVTPDGKQPWDFIEAAGYDYQYAGENLAVHFVDSKDVVDAWMDSPTHRANIVKGQYANIGVATAQGMYKGESATFVVQYFATPVTDATQALSGNVLGAASAASFTDSLTRNLMKLLSEPRSSSGWVLSTIAFVLMLALGFAFFHHIQLQAQDLLVPGTLVVAVAIVLLLVNSDWLSAGISAQYTQSATVLQAVTNGGVDIDTEAAQVER